MSKFSDKEIQEEPGVGISGRIKVPGFVSDENGGGLGAKSDDVS